jgi:serine protease Do
MKAQVTGLRENMMFVDELEQVAALIEERAVPSIGRIGRGEGRGAGIVIGEGTVVTNAHNLRGAQTTVTFADERTADGAVTGVDVDGDLAVLSVDTAGIPAVAWDAEGANLKLGSPVFTVVLTPGGGPRVTFGTVSALGRAFRGPRGRLIADGIEHTAPLGRGSSGGPLIGSNGSLVGINTHRLGDGLYLAVPADISLRTRIEALQKGESPHRLSLGVALAPPHASRRLRAAVGLPEREGLLVRAVEAGSPAARSGIVRGDLLVEAGGHPLASVDDLFEALDRVDESTPLHLRLLRGTDDVQLQVTFGDARAEGSA